MERRIITPRNNWQQSVEKLGFGFHTSDVAYWNEGACYTFTIEEINRIEQATIELWDMCLEAVQYVLDNKLYHSFKIPPEFVPHIEHSWNTDAPSIYARFDFGYNNKGELKMFECNADTPTSLFEAAIVQWFWLQDFDKSKDQFNSIHEKLIDYWHYLKKYLHEDSPLYFSCVKHSLEDLTTTEYLRDCAMQAGLPTALIYIDDIGWNVEHSVFVDMDSKPISNIFKLYPYEFMVREPFAKNILRDTNNTLWIEPSWKMLLSNKALLPLLWQLYPRCPYILEAYFEEDNTLDDFVKKPLLSREGANVSIAKQGYTIEETTGDYGEEGYICQRYFALPNFNDMHPVIGSWVVGQQAAGIGIREDNTLITGNKSCFVPHYII